MTVALSRQLLACVAVPFLLAACGSPFSRSGDAEDAYSQLHQASGVYGSFESIIDSVKAISAKHTDLTEIVTYGQTPRGRTLTLLRIQDKSVQVTGKRPAVLISEGIHGNEYLNITDRLPREFLEGSSESSGFKKLLAKGGVIYMVPILNPDGFSNNQRHNSRGVDLNRNWPSKVAPNPANGDPFTETETKNLADYIASEVQKYDLQVEMTLEYHCCSDQLGTGGLIHPWAYSSSAVLQGDDAARHKEIGALFKDKLRAGVGRTYDIVGYGDVGGSDDYYLMTYKRRAFSFEGTSGGERQRLAKHVEIWQSAFDIASQPYQNGQSGNPSLSVGNDLFLAVETEGSASDLSLLASAPDSYDGVEVCVGKTADCLAAGARKIAASAVTTKNGARIFRLAQTVTAPGQLVVFSLKGGKAQSYRAVEIRR